MPAAAAPGTITLPSPLTRLSPEPPLGGGATSSTETRPHRVDSTVRVHVSVDRSGAPFAVVALQRLVVRDRGDYVFTVAAPLADVAAAAGSQSTPGFRDTAILWTGFNPGTRTLAARAALRPRVLPLLPLRIERHGTRTTLIDQTQVQASALAADAQPEPLRTELERLRSGSLAQATAVLKSAPATVSYLVGAPLAVSGRIGARPVNLRLGGGAPHTVTVAATGPVDLTVRAVAVVPPATAGSSGRELLARTTKTLLSLARVRQYQAFLGNPDPAGRTETVYRYVSASRPTAAPRAGAPHGRSLLQVLGLVAAAIVAAALALFAWARA
ncbi:MAG TPA: hypothetical protein VLK36_03425 [Gaiellaceae bacterium]|nr:hypothetical protein [Gaiellaceae bacterium]